jgi:uncharacterized protein YjiS (DUF1127 family)
MTDLPPAPVLYVSRPIWLRLTQALGTTGRTVADLWPRLKALREARRQLDQERCALGHLSPHLLRDLGASPELIAEAHQADTLRAMRLAAHRF